MQKKQYSEKQNLFSLFIYLSLMTSAFLFIVFLGVLSVLSAASVLFGFIFTKAGSVLPQVFSLIMLAGFIVYAYKKSGISGDIRVMSGYSPGDKTAAVKKAGIYLIAAIMFSAAVMLLANVTGSVIVKTKINSLKKYGMPFSYKDLARKTPGGMNAALQIEGLSKEISADKDKSWKIEGYYSFRDIPNIQFAGNWGPGDIKKIKKITNNRYLKEFKGIVSGAGYYMFTDFSDIDIPPADLAMPALSPVLELDRQLVVQAGVYAVEGKYKKLLENFNCLLNAADLFLQEKTMISTAVAMAKIKYSTEILLALQNMPGTDELVEKAEKRYDKYLDSAIIENSLKTEFVMIMETFSRPEGIDTGASPAAWALYKITGAEYPNIYMFLDIVDKTIKSKGAGRSIKMNKVSVWPLILAAVASPDFSNIYDKYKELKFLIRRLKIMRAAKKYYTENSKYPEKIEALESAGLNKEELEDPFAENGGLLRLKKISKGIVIYSVGVNRADDGGKIRNYKDAGFVFSYK